MLENSGYFNNFDLDRRQADLVRSCEQYYELVTEISRISDRKRKHLQCGCESIPYEQAHSDQKDFLENFRGSNRLTGVGRHGFREWITFITATCTDRTFRGEEDVIGLTSTLIKLRYEQ
jgi:hypothetical protein